LLRIEQREVTGNSTATTGIMRLRTGLRWKGLGIWAYGRGGGVGRGRESGVDLGVGVGLGVEVGVGVGVAVAVAVAVGVGVGVAPPATGAQIATIIGEPVLKKPTVALDSCGG
jgi:hypothetical protein